MRHFQKWKIIKFWSIYMKLCQNNHLISTWCCWKINLIGIKLWMSYYFQFLKVSHFYRFRLNFVDLKGLFANSNKTSYLILMTIPHIFEFSLKNNRYLNIYCRLHIFMSIHTFVCLCIILQCFFTLYVHRLNQRDAEHDKN